MTNSFVDQVDDTVGRFYESVIGLIFDSRLSLINAFTVLIPFWSLVLSVDLIGRTQPQSKYILRKLSQFFILGLTINVTHNTYYFCVKGIQTFHGRMHLVAALCCLLFIIYLSFNFRVTEDVRYGFMISYVGISLSLFTLPLEYFPEASKLFSRIFFLGFVIYFLGLIIIAASTRAVGFMRRLHNQ